MEIVDLTTEHPARRALAELAERSDEEIDLVAGAFLVAAEDLDLDEVDLDAYRKELDDMGQRAQALLPEGPEQADRIAALHQVLFRERDISGEGIDAHDPDAALLPRVLESRRGLPITLAVIYIAVASRCGLRASGVAFPGHFLVRCDLDEGIVLVDPFNGGRTLDLSDLETLLAKTTGEEAEFDPSLLRPAASRAVLTRILSNLRAAYLHGSDEARALKAHERMMLLNPRSASLIRGRAALYERLGRADRAVQDLERVLAMDPSPDEIHEVRRELIRLRAEGRWVN